jgi:uncharacterized integral membrane protein
LKRRRGGYSASVSNADPLAAPAPPPEGRRAKAARMTHRGVLYLQAGVLVVLALVVLLLAVDNTSDAPLHWVVGDTQAPVVWIVLVSALVGWLAGIMTAVVFRRRTRRP